MIVTRMKERYKRVVFWKSIIETKKPEAFRLIP